MKIVMLDEAAIAYLAEASSRALSEGRTFRVAVDGNSFKYKVGEGSWSPPFKDQPDPYRD